LPKDHKVALLILSYRKLGVPVVPIEPEHRRLKCPRCDLEEDRDRIAVLNIEKRGLRLLNLSGGSLTAPTAPQMTDVTPNRCGEPMNRPFRAGRRSEEYILISFSIHERQIFSFKVKN
jgi:hypothetical protein